MIHVFISDWIQTETHEEYGRNFVLTFFLKGFGLNLIHTWYSLLHDLFIHCQKHQAIQPGNQSTLVNFPTIAFMIGMQLITWSVESVNYKIQEI